MKKHALRMCAVALMVFTPLAAHAQIQTATSTISMTVPEFHEFSSATATDLADIGVGLDPQANDLVSSGHNHGITVNTNSVSGATVALALASTGKPVGATSAWDNISIAVTGTSVTNATALNGSSAGTVAGGTYNGNSSNNVITGIKGGSYTYTLTYVATLNSRYALEGARSITATYTISL